jgi:hypothetical protein
LFLPKTHHRFGLVLAIFTSGNEDAWSYTLAFWPSCLAIMPAKSKSKPKSAGAPASAVAQQKSNVRSKKEKRDDDVMNVRNMSMTDINNEPATRD